MKPKSKSKGTFIAVCLAAALIAPTPAHPQVVSAPVGKQPDKRGNGDKIGSKEYYVQKFAAPGGNLSIDTYVDFEHDDAFVRPRPGRLAGAHWGGIVVL